MAASGPRKLTRSWHRWLGVLAAAPLLWLALSGVMLNHAAFFGLDDQEVTARWVLHRYQQFPEGEARGVDWGGEEMPVSVAEWGGLLFFQGRPLSVTGDLVGAVPYADGAAIAVTERVYIVSAEGTVVDRLDDTILPELPVQGVWVEGEERALVVRAAGKSLRFDRDLLEAVETEGEGGMLPVVLLNDSERDQLAESLARQSGIPLSRVILDLHSGKLLGWPGWLITDLAAVSLVVLTLLGLRLFPKRKR